jgi:hypothetical protein
MSTLKEYRDTERALERQLLLLESFKKNTSLMQTLEFEKKIQALMKQYSKTPKDIITLLDNSLPLSSDTVHDPAVPYTATTKRFKKVPESRHQ